jgi:hypothetical protein
MDLIPDNSERGSSVKTTFAEVIDVNLKRPTIIKKSFEKLPPEPGQTMPRRSDGKVVRRQITLSHQQSPNLVFVLAILSH